MTEPTKEAAQRIAALCKVVEEASHGWERLQEYYDGADKERRETGEVGSQHRDRFEAWLDCLVEDAKAALKEPH